MKKINLITVIFITTFLLTSCKEREQVESQKFETPTQLIKPEFAKELNINYLKERSQIITKVLGIKDANAAWYSIEELENYINYVKTEGEKQKIKINGIRFYLGVYPKDFKEKEKAGLTTVFLSPTTLRDLNRSNMQRFVGAAVASEEPNVDVITIDSENFGGMGNPPEMEYGQQH